MATKTLYLTESAASGSNHLALQDGGSAPTTATSATGWTVGKTASGNYARMDSGTERAANQFSSTAQPSGAPDNTLGDCFRTAALTGSFASGTWTLAFPVIAVSNSNGQDGRVRLRLWKSANADGSSASEITGATQTGSTVTDLATGAAQTSTVSFDPGAFSLSNEYLFVQVAWEIIGAGGNNSSDVLLRVGSAANIATSDFAVTHSSTGAISLGVVTASGSATRTALSSGASTLAAVSAAGSSIRGVLSAGAATLGAPTLAGTSVRGIASSGAVTLAAVTVEGAGTAIVASTGEITLTGFQIEGVSSRAIQSSGSISLPLMVVEGAASGSGLSTTSSGAVDLSALLVEGTGTRTVLSQGAVTLSAVTAAGSTAQLITSSGEATLGALTVQGVSVRTVQSVGAVTLSAPTLNGTSVRTMQSAGAITLAPISVASLTLTVEVPARRRVSVRAIQNEADIAARATTVSIRSPGTMRIAGRTRVIH